MPSEHKIPTGRGLTPLWVISLFLSLAETVLGVGVIATSGGIQIALTVFVIVFPLLIAGAFFAILWNRNHVLYPPHEFGQQVNVVEYVDAMQRRPLNQDQLLPSIDKAIQTSLQSKDFIGKLVETVSKSPSNLAITEVATLLKAQADKAVETIKEEAFWTIERFSEFSGFGSGTYNHGLGVVPDDISVVLTGGLARYAIDTITPTAFHITLDNAVSFRGRAIKYARPSHPK